MKKNVLITGAAGYVGSIVTRDLLKRGYNVLGFDNCMYNNSFSLNSIEDNPHFRFIKGDLLNQKDLAKLEGENIDFVAHLAAIVGDPACGLFSEKAVKVNYNATETLTEMMRKKVELFVLASTCSVYGKNSEGLATEKTTVRPVSLYGWTKILAEQAVLRINAGGLPACALRFATAYGLSPRPRFDLVVNLFILNAVKNKEITVLGGDQLRPFIHVKDMSKAISLCFENPSKASGEIFNVGNKKENISIIQLAEIVQKAFPDTKINKISTIRDERSYIVSYEKIEETLGFHALMSVEKAANEIKTALESKEIKDSSASIYYNS